MVKRQSTYLSERKSPFGANDSIRRLGNNCTISEETEETEKSVCVKLWREPCCSETAANFGTQVFSVQLTSTQFPTTARYRIEMQRETWCYVDESATLVLSGQAGWTASLIRNIVTSCLVLA